MQLTLSRAEIAELTRTPQRRRQVEFLQRNGIRHFIDQYGWPVVTRAAQGGSAGHAPGTAAARACVCGDDRGVRARAARRQGDAHAVGIADHAQNCGPIGDARNARNSMI